MDYYSSTLRKILQKPIAIQNIKNFTKELISGLSFLHSKKIIHGNLSSDVILVQKFSNHSSLIFYGFDILKTEEIEKKENLIYKPIEEFIEKDENYIKKTLSKKDVQLVDFIFQSTKIKENERASLDDLKKIFEFDNDIESILSTKKINFDKIEQSMKKTKFFIQDRYLNPKTFEGEEFINFIIKEFKFTIEESIKLGDLMISKNLIHSIPSTNSMKNTTSLYRFVSDENLLDLSFKLGKKDNKNDDHKLVQYIDNLIEKYSFVVIQFFRGFW